VDTSKIRRKARRNIVVVGEEIIQQGQELPKEVSDNFSTLGIGERNEYMRELRNAGWTLESIANASGGLTRERVRQITTLPSSPTYYQKISHLLVPELPTRKIYGHVPKELDPDVLKKLLDLKEKAFWVRGKSKANRAEAEEYSRLIAEQVEAGVSTYMIAKQLGVTHGAINFRLVRYGYKDSTSTNRVFRRLTHRQIETEGE
jgi:hypothetical protein